MKPSYKTYLRSAKWYSIRRRVLRRDKYRCRSCGKRAGQVHHGNYSADTLAGRNIAALFSVCRACHEAISLDVYGRKRPAKETRNMTTAMKKASPKWKKRKWKQKLGIDAIRQRSAEYAFRP